MITEQHIIDAYLHLRETNTTLPDEVLDFMKRASLEKLRELAQDDEDSIDAKKEKMFKKFGVKKVKELSDYCNGLEIDFIIVDEFVDYRNELKKPLKTLRPAKSYIDNLVSIRNAGYNVDEAIKMMKHKEWLTLELSYIQGKMHKEATGDLAQFGFGAGNAGNRLIQ